MKSKGHRILFVIIVISLLIKISLLAITSAFSPSDLKGKGALIGNLVGDQSDYYRRAIALIEGKGHDHYSTFRAPLYLNFLAIIFYLFQKSIYTAKLIQILLSTFNVIIVYLLTRRIFDERAGLISAFIFALYPTFIFFANTLWTETFFIFLLTSSLYLLIEFHYVRRIFTLLLAGLLWGFAALTRSTPFYFLPIIFCWFRVFEKGTYKKKYLHFSLFALMTLITIAPWTYRNYLVHQSFVPISTNGGWNFRVGNNIKSVFISKDDCWDWSFMDKKNPERYRGERGTIEERRAYKRGLRFILNNKLLFLKKSLWEGRRFYTLDSFALRNHRNGWDGNLPLSLIRALTIITVASYIFVMLTGTMGFIYSKNTAPKWLFIILIFSYTLLHSIMFSMSRYRVPIMPLIMIYSSYGLAQLNGIRQNTRTSFKGYILIACVIIWIVVWTFDIPFLSDMLSTGGKHFKFKSGLP